MPLALETVVKQLTDSGIIAQGKLENYVPPKASPKDAEELLRELHKQKLLTKFQAQQVAAGKAKSLILGEYTILDKIGAGGMGQVFKAQHRRMDRLVAIKTLPTATMKDAATVARFEREVKAAAKLRHPNIVAADDAGYANGVHFLVMEYVEGADLSALVKKNGPLAVEKAVDFILQSAKGLEFAHKRGVIHRDIKPANLLLDGDGTVKILDMGLARIEADGNAATQAELTGTGAVMGTVDYMAPEQARSTHHADARADIYSLGCSLYYLLTAKPLYGGETITNKLISHQFDPIPSFHEVRDDVPEQVEAIYQKMVAKKVEDRYQSMSEFIAELQPLTTGGSTMMSPTTGSTNAAESNSNLTFLKEAASGQTVQRKATKQIKQSTNNGRSKNNKLALIGAALLGVLIVAGIIVKLKTKDGTLIVEVDQPDAMVQVLDGQGKVEVSQKGGVGKVTISVDPGKHRLRVEKDGFTVFGQEFEMEKGGKKEIAARLEPSPILQTAPAFALSFDGRSSHVATPIRYNESFPITLECYLIDENEAVGIQHIVANVEQGGISLCRSKGKFDMHVRSGTGQTISVASKDPEPPNNRYHIAGVFDGKEVRLYIDGVLQGVAATQTTTASRLPLVIGGNPNGSSPEPPFFESVQECFHGNIDEVRISKVARYTGNFTPDRRFTPDAATIALYHFDEASGDTAFDSSDNKNHAKIVGAKWVRAGALGGPILRDVASQTPSSSTEPPIPAEALTFGGHRYQFIKSQGTWLEANTKAKDLGGHLVTINSKEEDGWLRTNLLQSLPVQRLVWLGGKRQQPNDPWTWVTGEPFEYVQWKDGGNVAYAGIAYFNSPTLGLSWSGSWDMHNPARGTTGPMLGKDRCLGIIVEWDSLSTPAPPPAKAPFDAAQAKQHQQAWAKHLGIEVETPNSVGMKMVLIPPGEFMMGSTDEQVEAVVRVAEEVGADSATKDRIRKTERPQHKVAITKPMLMSATEVTIGQFKKFAATGHVTEAEKAAQGDPKTKTYLSAGSDDLPAAYISWNDAVAYCQWLSSQEKTTYRLPTEAEWEYACRSGTTTQYSFGDDYNKLSKYGWHDANASGKSHPVGTLLPNGFGLFDMHGNLYEWCGDYFNDKWYSASKPNDPIGPSIGSFRVVRGGNWNHAASDCRSAYRNCVTPSNRYSYSGFRCVAELDVPTTTASVTPPSASTPTTKLFMHAPAFPEWMKQVQAMPAQEQIKAVSKKLVELNPGFDGSVKGYDGKAAPEIKDGVVTTLSFTSDNVKDISPIQVFTGLTSLYCGGSESGKSRFADLLPLKGMSLRRLNFSRTSISDLAPLQGMPLSELICGSTSVRDLTPLRGMALVNFTGYDTKVSDLSPLRQMPLTYVDCHQTPVADLSPLEACGNLKDVRAKRTQVTAAGVAALKKSLPKCSVEWDDPAKAPAAPAQASPKLFIHDPAFPQWMKAVQAMPADQQIEAVRKKLMELNPGFDGTLWGDDGKMPPAVGNGVVDGVVKTLKFKSDNVTDISPLRGLNGLTQLECGTYPNGSKLSDLSPLQGMKLWNLGFQKTNVSDLSPLRGMPLKALRCWETPVEDISPLHEAKLENLKINRTKVTAASVAALQKALPNCKIDWDDPAKATTPQPAASGTK